jgi:hypothetical protein
MKLTVNLYMKDENDVLQRLDLFGDESISLTSTIQNVKDISKVFTDFSQSFSVPASKRNNKLFKHYYNGYFTNGFDGRKKRDGLLQINNIDFRKGRIAIEEVEMKNNNPYAYKIVFYGETVSLKDVIGDDQLDSLDWLSNFDTSYAYSDVYGYMSNGRDVTVGATTYTDAIITPLISAEDRWIYDSAVNTQFGNLYDDDDSEGGLYTNLKYAIRLWVIFKAIEQKYPEIQFSTDFLSTSTSNFYSLYMWLHRERGKFNVASDTITTLNQLGSGTNLGGFYVYSNYFMVGDLFSYSAREYLVDLTIDVDSSSLVFDILIEKNGQAFASFTGLTGSTSYTEVFSILDNAEYRIKIKHELQIDVESTSNMYVQRIDDEGLTSTNTFTFQATQTLTTSPVFSILQNIPNMKIIDFLTSIFKMFNLVAYYSGDTIIVKTLDSYYSAGSSYNITQFVDMNTFSVKPYNLYKDITFEYSGLKTLLAEKHLELFNDSWGTEKYAISDKYDGETYTLSVPFEHMKYERLYDVNGGSQTSIMWGWSVDKLNNDGSASPYVGQPLVFYPILNSGTDIRITNGSSLVTRSSYYVPSNSISLTDSQTIHFSDEYNEYAVDQVFSSSLFSTYYSNYISSVFDYRMRIKTVTAYLPVSLITKIALNDTLIIEDDAYRINSMNYDLTTGKVSIELKSKL